MGGVDVALEWVAHVRMGRTWAHLSALYVKYSANVERARRRRDSMAACQRARISHDDEKMFFSLSTVDCIVLQHEEDGQCVETQRVHT